MADAKKCEPKSTKSLSMEDVKRIGAVWKAKHESGDITDNEYDQVADAFQMMYDELKTEDSI
jgi:hypothetical protein